MDRVVEAYVGEYASGKSEYAINRALELCSQNRQVKLVDLDIVDPFFTIRPIKRKLEKKGVEVIAWDTGEVIGLGEIGTPLKPEMKWALSGGGDVILDIGYGVEGTRTLNLVEGATKDKNLCVFAVVNVARPMTASVDDIVEYIHSLSRVDRLINNSHLGKETDKEIIEKGACIVTQVSKKLGIPMHATTVARNFASLVGSKDCMNNPVKILDLYMGDAFW